MKTRYKFIYFVKIIPQQGKTSKWECRNDRDGYKLGKVKWYGAWRQYCYFAMNEAVYSVGCLEDINHFIGQLEAERKPE